MATPHPKVQCAFDKPTVVHFAQPILTTRLASALSTLPRVNWAKRASRPAERSNSSSISSSSNISTTWCIGSPMLFVAQLPRHEQTPPHFPRRWQSRRCSPCFRSRNGRREGERVAHKIHERFKKGTLRATSHHPQSLSLSFKADYHTHRGLHTSIHERFKKGTLRSTSHHPQSLSFNKADYHTCL